jgi:hypothetical protein
MTGEAMWWRHGVVATGRGGDIGLVATWRGGDIGVVVTLA